ncbi:MAG: hypothetical protein ACPHL6_03045 [Rubripirellula sp.]
MNSLWRSSSPCMFKREGVCKVDTFGALHGSDESFTALMLEQKMKIQNARFFDFAKKCVRKWTERGNVISVTRSLKL